MVLVLRRLQAHLHAMTPAAQHTLSAIPGTSAVCCLTNQHALCHPLCAVPADSPAGHFFNGFTWRLKLTVKPPDPGSPNEMNIHVGLCWGIEVEGEGPLPLSENTMVQVSRQTDSCCLLWLCVDTVQVCRQTG